MKNEDIFSTDVEKVLLALKLELARLKTIWLPRVKEGDGEAGRLLEEALCIVENNRPEADIPIGDLKVAPKGTKTTLFSKEGVLLLPKDEIYQRFGFAGREHKLTLTTDANLTPNKQQFSYHCEVDGVYLACQNVDIQFWSWDVLTKSFTAKFPGVITVHYRSKKINGVQHFKFTNAYYFPSLDTTIASFLSELKKGNVTIAVRRYMESPERNHGTAFRVNHKVFNRIFETRQTII